MQLLIHIVKDVQSLVMSTLLSISDLKNAGTEITDTSMAKKKDL